MQVLALDLSLTSTGAAWNDNSGIHVATVSSRETGEARLIDIRNRVATRARGCAVVVIEGYSFGSKNGGEKLGELGGVIRVALFEAGIPYVEVAPSVVKKVATGRGNGSKPEVLTCAVRRLGYPGSSFDEADARWLLEAAAQWYRLPWMTQLPAAHRSGLGTVSWPKIDRPDVAEDDEVRS